VNAFRCLSLSMYHIPDFVAVEHTLLFHASPRCFPSIAPRLWSAHLSSPVAPLSYRLYHASSSVVSVSALFPDAFSSRLDPFGR